MLLNKEKEIKLYITEYKRDLKKILAYKNREVIARLCNSYTIEFKEAESLFTETKKLLFLMHHHFQLKKIGLASKTDQIIVDDSIIILDEVWHSFILFTKDYHYFCMTHFNLFLHHIPTPEKEKKRTIKQYNISTKKWEQDFQQQIATQMKWIYLFFGESTLLRWYKEYPQVYSKKALFKMRRKPM